MEENRHDPTEDLGPEEMGEPIQELRELEVEVSSGFLGRLINSLRRRSLVNQLATMAWTGMGEAIVEFMRMLFAFLNPGEPLKEDRTDG